MIITEYSIKNNINNLKINKANQQNLNRASYSDDRFVLSFKGYQEALVYAKKSKFKNRLFNKKLCNLNFEKYEGIQKGLKTFEGLSLKQIAFALTDLHSINLITGCKNHCLHCYANAQPFIKQYPFEDLVQICNDIKELKNRLGVSPTYHHSLSYTDCSFDSDALDCHLFDKKGNKHDFIEIAKLIKENLGAAPVFDTNGWKRKDKEKQKIAEEYVEKLLKDNNYKNFYQINISINPFRPEYVRVLKSGYSLDELYQPIRKVGDDFEQEEALLSDDYKKYRDLYTDYVKDVANTLITFKPLLKTKKLQTIIRALDNNIEEMKGFRINDFRETLKHIMQELYLRSFCGLLNKNELKEFQKILSKYNTRIFIASGRMENFYKHKNPNGIKNIKRIDPEKKLAESNYERIKTNKKLSAAFMRYLKMISADGRVYLYDNYSIIPTDIKLNLSTKEIKSPFKIPVKDFVVTEDMMDLI